MIPGDSVPPMYALPVKPNFVQRANIAASWFPVVSIAWLYPILVLSPSQVAVIREPRVFVGPWYVVLIAYIFLLPGQIVLAFAHWTDAGRKANRAG